MNCLVSYMNILMILSDNTFPPDIRVKKEAGALIGDGHKVSLIAVRGKGQSKSELVEDVSVFRYSCSFLLYLLIYRYLIFFHIFEL